MSHSHLQSILLMLRYALQPVRGYKTVDFGGTKEVVYERSDAPKAKYQVSLYFAVARAARPITTRELRRVLRLR